MMHSLLWLFNTLVNLYIWLLIGQAILSVLIGFGIVNARQPFVAAIGEFLYKITEPALRPIRQRLPNFGAIDVSPLVLILALTFGQVVVNNLAQGQL
jgi:YggT family protein